MKKEIIIPAAEEIEELILGAILLDQSCIDIAMGILLKDSFHKPAHAIIFNVMCELYNNRQAIDILTVKRALENKNELKKIGGATAITLLTNRIASGAHVEEHCRIVEQNAIARRVLNICQQTINAIYESPVDIFDHLNKLNTKLSNPDISIQGNDPSAAFRIDKTMIQITESLNGKATGIPTGFQELDQYTGGWQKGDLIVIAARPGMGKSALAIYFGGFGCTIRPVYMLQLEMSPEQVGMREIASTTKLKIQNLRTGKILDDDLSNVKEAAEFLKGRNFLIDFGTASSILAITSKIIKAKREHNICLAMIDYLQLIVLPKGDNVSFSIGLVTAALKRLAKELEIPIILFSQLNREVEKRPNNRPQLSDLRDSGTIEENADQVLLLYRPEYYSEDPRDENGNSFKGQLAIILAKNRQGGTGTLWVGCDLSRNIFNELENK